MSFNFDSELKLLIWQLTKRSYLAVLYLLSISLLAMALTTYENSIQPQGIVIHHSALPPEYQINKPEDVRIIADFHRERGFSSFYWGREYNIGYHYVILPDGVIVPGRPETCHGAHAKNFNTYIGIVLIGNFSEEDENGGPYQPTGNQMQSLVKLVRDVRGRYRIPLENVIPHRNVKPDTECPGKNFPFGDLLSRIE